ncbi:MAG: hypothetical protein PHU75_09400 [Candidatus Nanopelagicales bacterium]|nr:hypothetical protein [Candidatus Nanopelagicales bacterium]
MSDEMVAVTGDVMPAGLSLTRAPEQVLAEAKRAALALVGVIGAKSNPVKFNGEIYLEFEDWATVARFYSCTVRVRSTRFVQFGDVAGFEATADVIDQAGREVSTAEAMCLNDEEKWSERPKYEWVNGKRTQTGMVPVPLFQIRSMAQTRACAKALRNVFSWVVVLAGYKPTPAEEMDEHTAAAPAETRAPIAQPRAKAPAAPAGGELSVVATVEDVTSKDGVSKAGKPWTMYKIKAGGEVYSTFSDTDAFAAEGFKISGEQVTIGYVMKGEYRNLVSISGTVEATAEAEYLPFDGNG